MTSQNNDRGELSAIDWNAAASRQHQYGKTLVYDAVGDVAPLDHNERRFISQVAFAGGFLELASLLREARAAGSVPAPVQLPTGEAS